MCLCACRQLPCHLVVIANVHYALLLVSHCLFVVAALIIACFVVAGCTDDGGDAAAVASLLVI